MAAMSGHYVIDLEKESLQPLPDGFFDIIVMSHVIEHLPNGLDVLASLTGKLREEGRIYVEFPSVRSLALPSMPGTLNFCDDATHVRVYDIREISNLLLARGFKILKAGRRRYWTRVFLFPIIGPLKLLVRGRIEAGDFWDVTGFADYVFARKTSSPI
jgi:SAM-dependent methyltransferase